MPVDKNVDLYKLIVKTAKLSSARCQKTETNNLPTVPTAAKMPSMVSTKNTKTTVFTNLCIKVVPVLSGYNYTYKRS